MSHYASYKTKFLDLHALLVSLEFMGWKDDQIEIGHARPLMGFEGRERPEKAEIIIRRKFVGPSANDIGFAKDQDGCYQAIISDFDRHKHNDAWMGKLQQHYNLVVDRKKAKAGGWVVTETTRQDGSIKLILKR